MDPDATLEELRNLLDEAEENPCCSRTVVDISRISELFCSLDNWLSNSGFLPRDWQQHVVAHVGENID